MAMHQKDKSPPLARGMLSILKRFPIRNLFLHGWDDSVLGVIQGI
jgi:hypothetical protein